MNARVEVADVATQTTTPATRTDTPTPTAASSFFAEPRNDGAVSATPCSSVSAEPSSFSAQSLRMDSAAAVPAKKWQPYGGYVPRSRREASFECTSSTQQLPPAVATLAIRPAEQTDATDAEDRISRALKSDPSKMMEATATQQLTGARVSVLSLEPVETKTEPAASLPVQVSYDSPAEVLQDLLRDAPPKKWQPYRGYEPKSKSKMPVTPPTALPPTPPLPPTLSYAGPVHAPVFQELATEAQKWRPSPYVPRERAAQIASVTSEVKAEKRSNRQLADRARSTVLQDRASKDVQELGRIKNQFMERLEIVARDAAGALHAPFSRQQMPINMSTMNA